MTLDNISVHKRIPINQWYILKIKCLCVRRNECMYVREYEVLSHEECYAIASHTLPGPGRTNRITETVRNPGAITNNATATSCQYGKGTSVSPASTIQTLFIIIPSTIPFHCMYIIALTNTPACKCVSLITVYNARRYAWNFGGIRSTYVSKFSLSLSLAHSAKSLSKSSLIEVCLMGYATPSLSLLR